MTKRGRSRPAQSIHPVVRLEPRVITEAMPWIRRFAGWMGIAHRDLDDVAQEVIITAWSASERGLYRPSPDKSPERALIAWLNKITWHVGLSYLRSRRGREVPSGLDFLLTVEPNPDAWIDARAALAVLASVPEPKRSALLLTALGYELEEIARIVGKPVGTASARVQRGRRMLRRLLRRNG